MAPRTRARRQEDKDARRASIVRCARSLLSKQPYREITLAAIARRLGLTKGALYIYFPSREALFLEVLSEDLAEWCDALYRRLDRPEPWTPPEVADLLMIPGGPGLALMPMLHTLEQHADFEVVKRFKETLLRSTVETAERLERSAPFLPPGSAARFLVCAHNIMVGFRQQAERGSTTYRVMQLPHLRPLRPDIGPALRDVLTAVLTGWGEQTKTKRGNTPWTTPRKSPSRSSASAAASPETSGRPQTSTPS